MVMKLINEVFCKKVPVKEKLLAWGFQEEGDRLVYRKELLDSFAAVIEVKDQKVDGNVIDTETGETYMPLQYGTGSYAVRIRQAFVSLLEEIGDACCEDVPFGSPQADRLAMYLKAKYGEEPDFPFQDDDEDGVFRLSGSQKWYTLVMKVKRSAVTGQEDREIHILNLKVDPSERDALLEEDGIYPAYHMNHKLWITVLLDEEVTDERLYALAEQSRQQVAGKHAVRQGRMHWIIPSNPKYFDIVSYYRNRKMTSWRMYRSIQTGDVVYIYVGVPYQAIMYRCEVMKTDVLSEGEEHPQMIMTITDKYDPSLCTRQGMMQKYGVTNVRGPRRMPGELEAELTDSCSRG